jgi:hypothetical protein
MTSRKREYRNSPAVKSTERLINCLETVNLDRGLRDTLFNEESRDLHTLVSLQLDDLASLFVVN